MAEPWRVITDPESPVIRHYFPVNSVKDQVGLEQALIRAVAQFLVQSWVEQQKGSEVLVARES